MNAEPSPTRLSLLDEIRVASPCHESWDGMEGSKRVRFCQSCAKKVYNLSALSRRDAEALLMEEHAGLCIRLYRRADGTILTEDCPLGLRLARKAAQGTIRLALLVTSGLVAILTLGLLMPSRGRAPGAGTTIGLVASTVAPMPWPPVAMPAVPGHPSGWEQGGAPCAVRRRGR